MIFILYSIYETIPFRFCPSLWSKSGAVLGVWVWGAIIRFLFLIVSSTAESVDVMDMTCMFCHNTAFIHVTSNCHSPFLIFTSVHKTILSGIVESFLKEVAAYWILTRALLLKSNSNPAKETVKMKPKKTVYCCETCSYSTYSKHHLRRHLLCHTGEKPFSCKQCDYTCADNGLLKTHTQRHLGRKAFTCLQCDHSSKTASDLKIHMEVHNGEKPFSCRECDYKCARASTLKTHMLTHTGEKSFTCEQCTYKSATAFNLKSHMKTHSGVKPYSCTECNYKCIQSNNLKNHMRVHTWENPYRCGQCSYTSKQQQHLKSHLRIHSGEKPFICPDCGKMFTQSSPLNRHMSNKHRELKPSEASDWSLCETGANFKETNIFITCYKLSSRNECTQSGWQLCLSEN